MPMKVKADTAIPITSPVPAGFWRATRDHERTGDVVGRILTAGGLWMIILGEEYLTVASITQGIERIITILLVVQDLH